MKLLAYIIFSLCLFILFISIRKKINTRKDHEIVRAIIQANINIVSNYGHAVSIYPYYSFPNTKKYEVYYCKKKEEIKLCNASYKNNRLKLDIYDSSLVKKYQNITKDSNLNKIQQQFILLEKLKMQGVESCNENSLIFLFENDNRFYRIYYKSHNKHFKQDNTTDDFISIVPCENFYRDY